MSDIVKHPSHYTSHPSGVECITITKHMNFTLGSAFKYIWRAGLKDPDKQIEDLLKAIEYLKIEVERLKQTPTGRSGTTGSGGGGVSRSSSPHEVEATIPLPKADKPNRYHEAMSLESIKEIEDSRPWIKEADIGNALIEMGLCGLIWKDGVWKDGTWECGTWKGGVWKGGVWKGGIWEDGVWEGGIWEGGIWKDGIWEDGVWEDGVWKDGTWEGGTWKDGV